MRCIANLQVYNRSMSIFVDGLGEDGTPTDTVLLDTIIADLNYYPMVKVGQRMQGMIHTIHTV